MSDQSSPETPAPPRPPRRKKRSPLFWLAAWACIILAGVWTLRFVQRKIAFEETDDAYIAGHLHQVSSRVDGSVMEVLVESNQSVTAGQLLARLDPLPFEIALQKAKASLAEQKAGTMESQAAVTQAQAARSQAEAQVSSAEAQARRIAAQLQIATTNLARNQKLHHDDARAISETDIDTAQSIVEASSASLAGAQADAEAARAHVAAADAAIASAQAQAASSQAKIDTAAAAVRDAERELSYAVINAPSDGRIGNKNVERGNRVQTGQALFALVGNDRWIVANFKETQIKQMRPGQHVEITVDAIGGHRFSGTIDSISPATGAEFALLPPDNATGNFTKVVQRVPVKITFESATIHGFEDRLSPGLSAVVSVRTR